MNALTLSHTLQKTGLTVEQSEVIAQAIEDKNNQIVTKGYLDQKINSIYFIFALMGAGIGYLVSLIHTVIGKL